MPNYDRECDRCHAQVLDVLEPINTPDPKCIRDVPSSIGWDVECGGTLKRVIIGGTALNPRKPHGVIGDECDVWAQHGLCNEDGSPRHYTSKQEMSREAARRGLTNYVTHLPGKGTDKSKHTVRWI